MSTETSDVSLLTSLITAELGTVPLDCWGHFFPVLVATWRFIREKYPERLGEVDCGFDGEPSFRGQGADWFLDVLVARSDYLDAVEAILFSVLKELPLQAVDRGFLKASEVPALSETALLQMIDIIGDECLKRK